MNKTFLKDINVALLKSELESNNQTQFMQSRDSLNNENKDFGINYAEYGYNIGNGDKFMRVMTEDTIEIEKQMPLVKN
jgi:hypothetical protein